MGNSASPLSVSLLLRCLQRHSRFLTARAPRGLTEGLRRRDLGENAPSLTGFPRGQRRAFCATCARLGAGAAPVLWSSSFRLRRSATGKTILRTKADVPDRCWPRPELCRTRPTVWMCRSSHSRPRWAAPGLCSAARLGAAGTAPAGRSSHGRAWAAALAARPKGALGRDFDGHCQVALPKGLELFLVFFLFCFCFFKIFYYF